MLVSIVSIPCSDQRYDTCHSGSFRSYFLNLEANISLDCDSWQHFLKVVCKENCLKMFASVLSLFTRVAGPPSNITEAWNL